MSDIKTLPVKNKRNDNGLFLVPSPVNKCKHYTGPFEVDQDSGTCICKECGEKVTPIFVLKRLMDSESRWNRARSNYIDQMKRLKERSRTKCQHCGRMTAISRK